MIKHLQKTSMVQYYDRPTLRVCLGEKDEIIIHTEVTIDQAGTCFEKGLNIYLNQHEASILIDLLQEMIKIQRHEV